MSAPKAVLATFADAKTIRTRSVLQLCFEVPIEQADEALRHLGGFPIPAESRWVGIALAKEEREKLPALSHDEKVARGETLAQARRDEIAAKPKDRVPFDTLALSAQAAIRCGDQSFTDYLEIHHKHLMGDNASKVRTLCNVASRSELNTDPAAAENWGLLEGQYQAWLLERKYADTRRG